MLLGPRGCRKNEAATARQLLGAPYAAPPPQAVYARPSLCLACCGLLFYSLNWGEHDPETDAVEQEIRGGVEAVRRPTVVGRVAPTTAAKHAVQARSRPLRVDG